MFEEGELQPETTVAKFATVVNRGIRGEVEDQIVFYNLDMIISVGYRVHSYRGVQFRMWATRVLKEYIVKGFALNDDLLKRAGGGNYFEELLARIRDIRSCASNVVVNRIDDTCPNGIAYGFLNVVDSQLAEDVLAMSHNGIDAEETF